MRRGLNVSPWRRGDITCAIKELISHVDCPMIVSGNFPVSICQTAGPQSRAKTSNSVYDKVSFLRQKNQIISTQPLYDANITRIQEDITLCYVEQAFTFCKTTFELIIYS